MSKLQRLRDNIAAIECALKGENNSEVLGKYTGFGGLNFILNGTNKSKWTTKSDIQYYDDTVRLHKLLIDNSESVEEMERWVQSLKNSTLTAFYTPIELVDAMMIAIYGLKKSADGVTTESIHKGRKMRMILDPAAGQGVFATTAGWYSRHYGYQCVCYEKDLLTGLLLSRSLNRSYYDFSKSTTVRVDGFETIPASELGKFDLVSTNVPFGDIKVYDPLFTSPVRKEALKMIHRYYVLKGLDCLREGGLLAYIITSNYLNNDTEQVQEALKQSRLIGAYRLANNLFKENGTEVGTDLLVLQKDSKRGELTEDEKLLLLTQCTEEGCPTNYYFVEHYDRIMATGKRYDKDAYGKPGIVYLHDGGVSGISEMLSKILAEDMKSKCDAKLFEKGSVERNGSSVARNGSSVARNGSSVARNGSSVARNGSSVARNEKRMTRKEKVLMEIMEAYRHLEQYERENQTEQTETRATLNAYYDGWVNEYGHFHDAKNRKDVERVNKELLALEMKDDSGYWAKADIFFKPVAFSTEEQKPMTATEALAACLNEHGCVDMHYICDRTGKDANDVYEELKGEIFWNPIGNKWEIKAQFISGNVIEKLEQIKPYYERAKERGQEMLTSDIQDAIAALEAAVPTPIPFADLDFNLGERWVETKVYEDFANDFFSMPEVPGKAWMGGKAQVTVRLVVDQYVAAAKSSNEKIRTQYSVTCETGNKLDGMDLLQHALNDTTPKLMRYKRNERGAYVMTASGELAKEEDPNAVQMAKTKIDEIRTAYTDWLQRQPKELRDRLADEYNKRFNCFVKPVYDGSHQTFPDLDRKAILEKYGVKDLYKSQKDCIWMLLLNGGGICDHEVGSGKTLIMCITAHEMKRLGMCHKPMIIGLKANVAEIANTYRTCYPKAKVLYAEAKDYSNANRVDFFNRMKTGDWDVIIMSHEQFGRIPQPLNIERDIHYTMLQQVEDSLEAINRQNEGYEITSKMQKGLEKRKANLAAKLAAVNDKIKNRKDEVSDFEELGIDHIFVDESHQFKNLGFVTRHDRVAGLGNTEGSQRAFNMLMAIRTIQNRTGRDLGATFLSGTTVTNSLTELYLLFHYLRPKALEKQGITCFDAWAAIFCKKSAEYEFGLTNTVVLKERFRYFIKVPELAQFYNEITDYKTAEDVGIVRPKKEPKLLKLEPTKDQAAFIKTLMKFAQTGDFSLIGVKNPTDAQRNAKMLYATDLARKMSLDMRLIDPSYGDDPGNKVSRCAEKISQWYHAFDEMKGTQLVFSDLSTWDSSKWNVYAAIRDKLVDEYGIPKNEIRFIQEAKNDQQKQELIKLTNEGKVRVLFGSTTMLGTGVNAQKRVVCVHHLDTPWRPSDLEQRDGRAVRKGNEVAAEWQNNEVVVIIYAVERTLDAYKFQLLHAKQVFISQLKRGQLSVRTLDEGAMDEKSGMNYAEYMAVLSGNTDLLERAKLEKRIAALEGERKNFYREHHAQEEKLALYQRDNERLSRDIAAAQEDQQRYEQARRVVDGYVVNNLVIDNFATDAQPGSDEWVKDMARELMRIDSDTLLPPGEYRTVGTVCGFPVVVRTELCGYDEMKGTQLYKNHFMVQGRLLHTLNNGQLPRRSYGDAVGYGLGCLQQIAARIEAWQERMEYNAATISQLQEILKATWGKDTALAQMKQDLVVLDQKIAKTVGLTEEEQKAQQCDDKTVLPYTFDRERGEYTVKFKRDLLSLISIEEMRKMADGISYASRVRDWSGYREQPKPDRDIEVIFNNANYPDAFILKALDQQHQREKDHAWISSKAAEDTNGNEATQENETIFAARRMMREVKKAA